MRRRRGTTRVGLVAGAFALAAAVAQAQDPTSRGSLSGAVRDSSGAGIAGAEILVGGTDLRAFTNGQGEFRLTSVPAGAFTVSVRRLGFLPMATSVVVAPNTPALLSVVVAPLAQSLATVVVRGDRRSQDKRLGGFYMRRSRSSGGHFITRDHIDQRRPSQTSDLFRTVPGARIMSSGYTNRVRFRGMRCAPLVWIDGFPATAAEFDLDAIDPYVIEAIEVYPGVASVPSEFRWVRGGGACGAIVIWTGFEERRRKERMEATATADLSKQVEDQRLFTADQVDVAARTDASSAVRPAYPDSLYRERITGQVLVEFVVDTTGLVSMESVSGISSTHALFTDAVRLALRDARFHPATIRGRKVRQLVQLPVKFELPTETSKK